MIAVKLTTTNWHRVGILFKKISMGDQKEEIWSLFCLILQKSLWKFNFICTHFFTEK